MRVLPILFNTEMIRAIMDGRKTVTRRLVKPRMPDVCPECMHIHADYIYDRIAENIYCAICGEPLQPEIKPSYQPGDILYVREIWNTNHLHEYSNESNEYVYKADYDGHAGEFGWRPSIHMPKEAARIWLKVTDVKVERLKSITEAQALKEGFKGEPCSCGGTAYACTDCYNTGWIEPPLVGFMYTWESTIKKVDINRYGWNADPWVWVIEFEHCEKPDENETTGLPEWKDNFMQRFCKIN